jgi:hypothetical protein
MPSAAPPATSSDHRRAPRRQVATPGLLIHGRSLNGLRCTVRDVSGTGARVKLKSSEILSRPLFLIIDQAGAAFTADIAWARNGELGLAFKDRLNLLEPKSDLEKSLFRGWKSSPPA